MLRSAGLVAVVLIAVLHLWILVMESFLWQSKAIRKRFGMDEAKAALTAQMAKNQGLYNGFLAAGLIWALFTQDPEQLLFRATFFLACIAVAGVVGAITAMSSILYVQTVPALIALGLLWASR